MNLQIEYALWPDGGGKGAAASAVAYLILMVLMLVSWVGDGQQQHRDDCTRQQDLGCARELPAQAEDTEAEAAGCTLDKVMPDQLASAVDTFDAVDERA
jgi:hypothetical protein